MLDSIWLRLLTPWFYEDTTILGGGNHSLVFLFKTLGMVTRNRHTPASRHLRRLFCVIQSKISNLTTKQEGRFGLKHKRKASKGFRFYSSCPVQQIYLCISPSKICVTLNSRTISPVFLLI
eukprot:Lithocolla_globosa_v1_NODE_46_length_7973_cov_21.867264.p6 type:complete len:121 gc:universal NODE_46_length_7973_cov_21.867264:1112-750(-)